MNHPTRRAWLRAAAAATLPVCTFALANTQEVNAAAKRTGTQPFRIYAITFRGMTDVEKGFEEYFASRKIPVQIIYRDLNRDATRMPGFLDEIRATRPDLVYTWGTSVTLGVLGPYRRGQPEPAHHRHSGRLHAGGLADPGQDRRPRRIRHRAAT